MSTITPAFALAVRPSHFNLSDRVPGGLTIRMQYEKQEYCVSAVGKARFRDEYAAWQQAVLVYPDVIDQLQRSDKMDWRAYGLRGEMMLKMGWDRFKAMQDDFEKEIVYIFEHTLRALDAVKLTKAAPLVVRVAKTRGISWLEVRASVRLSYEVNPVTVAVRCIPSPVEEKTWSVRMRVLSTTDSSIAQSQARFEELVRSLSYQGIIVKDVQNGTYMDL